MFEQPREGEKADKPGGEASPKIWKEEKPELTSGRQGKWSEQRGCSCEHTRGERQGQLWAGVALWRHGT